MRALALRLEAPLMAFGGVLVDDNGVVTRFPARSLLTGLLANALGYDQGDFAAHQRLQERLRFAVRLDRAGELLEDFQTVDLGQPHLCQPGWTTRGQPEGRKGGTAATGTHIRHRHYHADASLVVVLALDPAPETPTLDDLTAALSHPARPLFLGRKTCLPATYLAAGMTEAPTLLAALRSILPLAGNGKVAADAPMPALWPAEEDADEPGSQVVMLSDDRDWCNQVHTGLRPMRQGRIRMGGAS